MSEPTPQPTPDPQPYYFTFGSGSPLANYYIRLEGTFMGTRLYVAELFSGQFWCGQYRQVEYEMCIAAYGLQELKMPERLYEVPEYLRAR